MLIDSRPKTWLLRPNMAPISSSKDMQVDILTKMRSLEQHENVYTHIICRNSFVSTEGRFWYMEYTQVDCRLPVIWLQSWWSWLFWKLDVQAIHCFTDTQGLWVLQCWWLLSPSSASSYHVHFVLTVSTTRGYYHVFTLSVEDVLRTQRGGARVRDFAAQLAAKMWPWPRTVA